MADEWQGPGFVSRFAADVDREELLSLLEVLRAEEEEHLTRLHSLLSGLEARRPGVARWFRSIRRLVPVGYPH